MEKNVLNPRFVESVLAWIDGTGGLKASKEKTLRTFVEDAGQVTPRDYPRLYRGQPITDDQLESLKAGEPVALEIQGLRSWTTKRQVAMEWAEAGGDYPAICIVKMGLPAFLDIRNFMVRTKGMSLPPGDWEDALRYGAREFEVIVDHAGPLIVHPEEVHAYCGDEYGPVTMRRL